MTIRELERDEYAQALALADRVFDAFEAPDYPREGVEAFHKSIREAAYLSALRIYAAFDGDRLAGMLATRSEGAHIALFFVEERYQRRGIGRALFRMAAWNCPAERMTVHSSPFAVPVYRALGFSALQDEQVADGIRFTPMACVLAPAADCPCKRTNCERHGDCTDCTAHHHASEKQPLTACERRARKEERRRSRAEARRTGR